MRQARLLFTLMKPKDPIIIAELGTLHHHQGKKGVMSATRDALNAGADLVKIQCISPSHTDLWATQKQRLRYQTIYKKFAHPHWRDFFFEANQRFKRPVYPSVFDIQTVQYLRKVVPYWKIAQRSSAWMGLIEAVQATGIPYFVSLSNEYPAAWFPKPKNAIILHCPAFQYPLADHPIFARHIVPHIKNNWYYKQQQLYFPSEFSVSFFSGLSIHSNETKFIVRLVKETDSKVVEVHVQGKDAQGPDTQIALTLNQLTKLRRQLNIRTERTTK